MAIRWIGSAWQTDLETGFPSTSRFYIDFKREDYPGIEDTYTYTAITVADNQPGSYNLTGGYGDALLKLDTKVTVVARVKPTFAYDDGDDHPLHSWYGDANNYLTILYTAADDMYTVKWKDGGNERVLKSDAYESDEALQVWTDICLSFDSTTGDTTGSALYIDRVAVDEAWDDAIDAMSYSYEKMSIRHEAGAAGDFDINYLRVFPAQAIAAADVANDFEDIKLKEVYWHFNDESVGRSRWNVSRHALAYYITKEVAKQADGSRAANIAGITLLSNNGEFADDQFAAFDADNDVFNGLDAVGQRYLRQRCRVTIEHWYSNLFEPLFVGRIDEELFTRESALGDVSRVNITCEDAVGEVARKSLPYGKTFEDYSLSAATQATSLVHSIMRLATRKEYANYLANASFENTTISDSWTIGGGGGGTFVRATVATSMFGDHQADLARGTATNTVDQVVTFEADKKLNVGESYNFSIFLKGASAAGNNITLAETTTANTVTDSTDTAYAIAGGEGWERYNVTHTVADATSNRLKVTITLDEDTTLSVDGAMLTQDDEAINWWLLNDNDGASGVESADDADSDTYDTVGFDTDAVAITHPWVPVLPYTSIWEYMKDIADATAARYMGMTADGTFRFRSILKAGYSDPSVILTCDTTQGITSTLTAAGANTIIVHGVNIVKETTESIVWSARASAQFDGGEPIHLSVNNGATWPAPAVFGPFWAKYGMLEESGQDVVGTWYPGGSGKSLWTDPFDIYSKRYKRTQEAKAVIGVKSARLTQAISDSAYTTKPALTETIFDTTTRADAARILLTNASGATRYINSVLIIGQPVLRFAHAFLHDSFVNLGDVQRNGEIKFELGNDMIITKAQVESLADHWWKVHDGKKHSYDVRLPGCRHYYEPGEWYTLDIGAAGTKENIDATVVCEAVSVERAAGELGTTTITFHEIEANWVKDSHAVARYLAQGRAVIETPTDKLIVGANGYEGIADYYCDGAADGSQINTAISWLFARGGGIVQLTTGTYAIGDAIQMKSDVMLQGVGTGTVLERNISTPGDYHIHLNGTGGAHLSNIAVSDLKCTRHADDYDDKIMLYASYVDNLTVQNCHFVSCSKQAVYFLYVENGLTQNCYMESIFTSTINYVNSSGEIVDNAIDGKSTAPSGTPTAIGIDAATCPELIIANNIIRNLKSATTSICVGIQLIDSDYSKILGNIIHDVDSNDRQFAYGIRIRNSAFVTVLANDVRKPYDSVDAGNDDIRGISFVVATAENCDDCIVTGNRITESERFGIYIGASVSRTQVTTNFCKNNGSDSGVTNENEHNFNDLGTDTHVI